MFRDIFSRHASPAATHDVEKESREALAAPEDQTMHAMSDGAVDNEWDIVLCVFTCATISGGRVMDFMIVDEEVEEKWRF